MSALAQRALAERKQWRHGEAARTLLLPWKKCPELWNTVDNQDDSPELMARRTPAGAEVTIRLEGNGRWGLLYEQNYRFQRDRCAAAGYSLYGLKEGLDFELRRLELGDAPKPTLDEVARHQQATRAQPDDTSYAAERLLVFCTGHPEQCNYGHDTDRNTGGLGAPLFPIQPEHPGRPTGSPEGLWTTAELNRAGVEHLRIDDDGTSAEAVAAGPLHPPWLLTTNGRYELWELRFRARNGGGMLAIYDKQRNRHRWVFATKGDWQPGDFHPPWAPNMEPMCRGHFQVVAFDEKQLWLATFFENRDYLFLIDPVAGTARPALLSTSHADYRPAAAGIEVIPLDDEGKPAGKATLFPLPH